MEFCYNLLRYGGLCLKYDYEFRHFYNGDAQSWGKNALITFKTHKTKAFHLATNY